MEKVSTCPQEKIGDIDLQPTPRVLRMLGNISFENWQCFAELIDNSIDAIKSSGIGSNVSINTPTQREFAQNPSVTITCVDDGPGMTRQQLQNSMKAGYSSNDPLSYLGLFGMGFNIATARLGTTTQVITTREGDDSWISVTIDLLRMERERSYIRPLYKIEKEKPEIHGTIVIISNLLDRAKTIRKQTTIKKKLSRIYTPIIQKGDIKIFLNDEELVSYGHCIWSPKRYVKRKNPEETIPAYIEIDQFIGKEYYCENCWEWISDVDVEEGINKVICPKCNENSGVSIKERRIKGWIGVQRYYDPDHYGFDLIRNGRVIEELDKSLFYWMDPDTGDLEKEYVLDSTLGGRIIGELQIDFVPLTYMKDHFERADKTWNDVERAVRGIGPIRPEKAQEKRVPRNDSPLGQIYRGYKKANKPGYDDLLPGKKKQDEKWGADNKTPKMWAEKFYAGVAKYQEDTEWWELVKQTERSMRGSPDADVPIPSGSTPSDVLPNTPNDDRSESVSGQPTPADISPSPEGTSEQTGITSEKDVSLSQEYLVDGIGESEISVTVNILTSGSLDGSPFKLKVHSKDNFEAVYDPKHPFFSHFNQEPLDLLLLELAQKFCQRKDDVNEWPASRIYWLLKEKYSQDKLLSPKALSEKAKEMLNSIKRHIIDLKIPIDPSDLDPEVVDEIRRKVLLKLGGGDSEVRDLLRTTGYIAYAPDEELIKLLNKIPESFMDNTYWKIPYVDLGMEELKQEVKAMFSNYLNDLIWLKKESADYSYETMTIDEKYRLQRASLSMKLLEAHIE